MKTLFKALGAIALLLGAYKLGDKVGSDLGFRFGCLTENAIWKTTLRNSTVNAIVQDALIFSHDKLEKTLNVDPDKLDEVKELVYPEVLGLSPDEWDGLSVEDKVTAATLSEEKFDYLNSGNLKKALRG